MRDKIQIIIKNCFPFLVVVYICVLLLKILSISIEMDEVKAVEEQTRGVYVEEIKGEVEVVNIKKFTNVKGGFSRYGINFRGIEYPDAKWYEDGHSAMFNSSNLGSTINKGDVKIGTKFPATFTLKRTKDSVEKAYIKEVHFTFE